MNKILNKEFLVTHREQLIKAIAVIVVIAVAFFVFTNKGGDEEDAAAVSGEPGQTETVQEQGAEGSTPKGMLLHVIENLILETS